MSKTEELQQKNAFIKINEEDILQQNHMKFSEFSYYYVEIIVSRN